MEIKTIYIAGLMNGLTEDQIAAKFNGKQKEMEQQGYKVINPLTVVKVANDVRRTIGYAPELKEGSDRKKILGLLLQALSCCDELHLLPCWQASKGAQLERHFAQSVGMPIVYH